MIPSASASSPSPSLPAGERLRAAYRRLCLQPGEAGAPSVPAREAALASIPADSVKPAERDEIFAQEDERIANARALAEVLSPLLLEKLATLGNRDSSKPPRRKPSDRESGPTRRPPSSSGRTPSIADLLEGMASR